MFGESCGGVGQQTIYKQETARGVRWDDAHGWSLLSTIVSSLALRSLIPLPWLFATPADEVGDVRAWRVFYIVTLLWSVALERF